MSIEYNKEQSVFLLNTLSSTYVIRIIEGKYVLHGGWFKKISNWTNNCVNEFVNRGFCASPAEIEGTEEKFSLGTVQLEYPTAGTSDFRTPAIEAEFQNGTKALELYYKNYEITQGKPAIPGLPSTYTNSSEEAETLKLTLEDAVSGLEVNLFYTVWNNLNAICRSTSITHTGKGKLKETPIALTKCMSMNIDFTGKNYKMIQLSGAWARERQPVIRDLVPGMQSIESRRGSSSHTQNPFLCLMEKNANEESGTTFGFNFVYSGNFIAGVEVDPFNTSRLFMGINPYNFKWQLKQNETFYTPEVVMVRSENGLGEMSRTFHDLYRNNLCRGKWAKKERPILINNWEATYFDFTEEKLLSLADTASKLGIELFVLDDGWFGKRNDDHSSLGDWFLNEKKLPCGLKKLGEELESRGLKFGLWVEPEMISPDSELYRKHPDWCLHIEHRGRSLCRHQCVLNMSRSDVREYIFETLSNVFSSAPISYVKWDFNRNLTEVGSELLPPEQQLEVSHRYVLGLYELLEKITKRFPNILFESCSGGGGRFDAAMLYYMPQTWTSDNTDADSRVTIQNGTSLAYPASAMSCHVSAVPNHQMGRTTSLNQRGHVAMAGTFGYELDLTKLPESELNDIKTQVDLYKSIRNTVLFGDQYRLKDIWEDPAKNGYAAWMYVSKDKKQAVTTLSWIYRECNVGTEVLKLKGLDEKAFYKCSDGKTYSAEELMNAGIRVQFSWDARDSYQWIFTKI